MTALLCAVFGYAGAQETFVFANMGYTNAEDITTVNGQNVTLTFDKGTGSNAPKYYDSGTNLRFYGGNTLTIASAKDIASVQFTCTNNYDVNADVAFSTGSYADGTWTGPAKEVTITNGGKAQVRFTAITVNFADGTVSKTAPGLKVDDVTVTEGEKAALSITSLSDGALTFTSSKTAVATVAATGTGYEVSGIAPGTATITVQQAETNDYTAAETTFEVNVTPYIAPGSYATVEVPYTVDFTKTQDVFVIEDVANELGTDIWTQSGSYGMVATSYVQLAGEEKKANHDGESWLVSPIIDLTAATTASLTFSHNWNGYFGDYTSELGVFVREEGGSWSRLGFTYEKPTKGFIGWRDEVADLSAYAGKKIQVGFYYKGTATTAGTYEVRSFSVTTEAAVVKEAAELSYSESTFTATIGEENAFPTLDNPNGLDITYKSSHEDVATVAADGTITLVAPGQTTIIATSEESDNFLAGEAKYTLVVKEKAIVGTIAFELVDDAASLAAGDEIIIVNADNDYAISTTQKDNNRAAETVALEDDGTIIPSNLVQVITLEGSAGNWNFNTGSGYLYAASNGSNYLKTEASIDADGNANAAITIDAEGVATITFQGTNARNTMRYNPNSGNPIFSCYASTSSTGTLTRIYRSTVSAKPAAGLAYSATEFTANYGQENTFPTLDNPNGLDVTYTSLDEAVATIDANGTVTLVGEGTTTISATSEENDDYKAGSASYKLIVVVPLADNDDKFELVSDLTTLAAGDEIILVGKSDITEGEGDAAVTTTSYYGLGTNQKANNREGIAVTYNEDGTITGNTKLQTITLEGEEDDWYFNVGSGYLYAASSDKNYLRTEAEADANASAIISTTENGLTIVFQGGNTRNELRFNYNNGTPLFSCYANSSTTGTAVNIYRKAANTLLMGDANGDGTVTVADVLLCVDYSIKGSADNFHFANADTNGDGVVGVADIMAIVSIVMGN